MLHDYTYYVNRCNKISSPVCIIVLNPFPIHKPLLFSKHLPRHEPDPAVAFCLFGHEGVGADAVGVVQAGEPVAGVGVGKAYAPAFEGHVQKNSFGITWSQHLSGICVVADSTIPRTGAILLSRNALYPMKDQYFQGISFIFVMGKLSIKEVISGLGESWRRK